MWTDDHKRSDANHTAWINIMQSNTTNCDKLGLMTAQRSYNDPSTAQVTAPDLFGGFFENRVFIENFLSRFEKTDGGEFMNPLHSPEERTQ